MCGFNLKKPELETQNISLSEKIDPPLSQNVIYDKRGEGLESVGGTRNKGFKKTGYNKVK